MDRISSALNNLGITKQLQNLTEVECQKAYKLKLKNLNLIRQYATNDKEKEIGTERMKQIKEDYNVVLNALKNKSGRASSNKANKNSAQNSNQHGNKTNAQGSSARQKYWTQPQQIKSFDFLGFWVKFFEKLAYFSIVTAKIIISAFKFLFNKFQQILSVPSVRKRFITILLLAFFGISLIYALFAFHPKHNQEYGYIVVKSYPWAKLFVNGEYVMNVPSEEKIKVQTGLNNIKLVFVSIGAKELRVDVKKDEILFINLNTQKR